MPKIDVGATNGTASLAGSIWSPEDRPPLALILMYPGSGPSDRDNDIFFPPIRRAFLSAGFAVVSFDKRGVGASTGTWLEAGISDQADDLVAFLSVARAAVPDVPVGLFGHSQGGWVVIEASACANPDFLITSSGPSVTPRVQEEFSTRASLEGDHAAKEMLQSFSELLDRAGNPWKEVADWMAETQRAEHFVELMRVGAFVPDCPELWGFAELIMKHDPAFALSELTVPLLVVLGSADTVVPVEESAVVYRRSVRPDLLELRILEGGDHRMQHPGTVVFLPEYLPTLATFAGDVLKNRR
jgi:uncharacterized protein